MNDTLKNLLEVRKQAAQLEQAARKELQTEFTELLSKAAELYQMAKENFEMKLTFPANVKFSVTGKPARRRKTAPTEAAPAVAATTTPAVDGRKIGALKRALVAQQKKLAETKAAGKPTQKIEDRIYEIKDELQLLTNEEPEVPTETSEEDIDEMETAGETTEEEEDNESESELDDSSDNFSWD